MRLLNDNVLYEFNVEQGDSRNADHGNPYCDDSDSDSVPIFRIVIRYRKFQAPIRRPVAATERSLDLPRDYRSWAQPLMSRILAQFDVPSRIGEQMVEHFRFFAERLARRFGGEDRGISVSVRLDVKVLSPETAGGVRARMESARAADAAATRRWREEGEEDSVPVPVPVPARRSSIEALEKVRVGEDGGGRECAICLEEMRAGAEAARMPCGHLYHCSCIAEWLQRTHFCPFCRFKMPC